MTNLPILLYNNISYKNDPAAMPPELFESHMEAMREQGYVSVGLDQLADYFLNGAPLPEKSVCITFDDGLLDNYIFAYPILKKHGFKAVMFAVVGMMEEEGPLRLTLEDVWNGLVQPQDLPKLDRPIYADKHGFLARKELFINWAEAAFLHQSGVIEIAAHGMRHDLVYKNKNFKTFYQPGEQLIRFDNLAGQAVLGLPRFQTGPALTTRAFIPSDALVKLITSSVPQDPREAKAFFAAPGVANRLKKLLQDMPREDWGYMETEAQTSERVRADLEECRRLLCERLGAPPRALSWPWDAASARAEEIAWETGFDLLFSNGRGPNKPGQETARCKRLPVPNRSAKWLIKRLRVYSGALTARLGAVAGF